MKRTPRTPSYRHHKGSDQGFVELDGRRIYLGKWGLPETEERYHRSISEWLVNGRRLRVDPHEITIAELAAGYAKYAGEDYIDVDGIASSQLWLIKRALRPLVSLYGHTRAADFGPIAARTIRQTWIDQGLARKTVNTYFTTLKAVFC